MFNMFQHGVADALIPKFDKTGRCINKIAPSWASKEEASEWKAGYAHMQALFVDPAPNTNKN